MAQTNRQKEIKRHKKYEIRKRFLTITGVVVAAFIAILCSPLYMGGGKVNLSRPTTTTVANNAEIKKISSALNPKTGFMVSEFYVGNSENVDDLTADRALSNIKYQTRAMVQHGGNNGQTTFKKVNDHFFVMETKGLTPGFNVIRYDIIPQLIDKNIETDGFVKNTWIKFYTRESDVAHKNVETRPVKSYNNDYISFVTAKYEKKISNAKTNIKNAEATKKRDQQMIDKMKAKKKYLLLLKLMILTAKLMTINQILQIKMKQLRKKKLKLKIKKQIFEQLKKVQMIFKVEKNISIKNV